MTLETATDPSLSQAAASAVVIDTNLVLDLFVFRDGAVQALHAALRQGIDKELGKRIVKEVKGGKFKVQVAIQGDELRVTGKKRDDLQAVIQFLKGLDIEQPLQFENFRD